MEGEKATYAEKPSVIVKDKGLFHETLVYYIKEKKPHHKNLSYILFS